MAARTFGGRVAFPVPRQVAFDYLIDPHQRPQWQSSLARVSAVDGEPREGQTWVDETLPGLKPQMRTTHLIRPRRWAESGTWRFVRADLTLDFEIPIDEALHEDRSRCEVVFEFRIHALGPVGLITSLLSCPAVAGDLRRASRILGERRPA